MTVLNNIPHPIEDLLRAFDRVKGAYQAYLTGGSVRDLFLGEVPRDYDIEIFACMGKKKPTLDTVSKLLSGWGYENYAAGKSFEVLQIRVPGGYDVQASVAKVYSVTAGGLRRDLTMNAMYADANGDVTDAFGGIHHINAGILHPTTRTSIIDDPLRIFRVMQFASRFGWHVSDDVIRQARAARLNTVEVSLDRIAEEWMKWAKFSKTPSKGIDFLEKCGILAYMYPEIANLKGTLQNPRYHPEGDAYTHTLKVIDAIAWMSDTKPYHMMAGLLHDTGKADTTSYNEYGNLQSKGHSEHSVEHTKKFLKKIRFPEADTVLVEHLVREHMARIDEMGNPAIRRLAVRLSPASIKDYLVLRAADLLGQNTPADLVQELDEEATYRAEEAHSLLRKPDRILMGRHLLQEKMLEPGPDMGEVLDYVYEWQLEDKISNLDQALELARTYIEMRFG